MARSLDECPAIEHVESVVFREFDSTEATRKSAARIIAEGSRSFALAGRILAPSSRLDAQLIYAWCRHVDDAIDASPPEQRLAALEALRAEVDSLYAEEPLEHSLWNALREVLRRRQIPREHLDTLLSGMQMDVQGTTYQTLDDLRLYCHRVAGVVGWLMVAVLGVNARTALRPAAHLGIAMQLTNICRDVAEDWRNARLYLPNDLLTHHGAKDLHLQLGGAIPGSAVNAIAATVRELLQLADRHYRTGAEGLSALSLRASFAVRTAGLVYAAIGERIKLWNCDPLRGRAVVPAHQKVELVLRAATATLAEVPRRLVAPHQPVPILEIPRYPDDLLPW